MTKQRRQRVSFLAKRQVSRPVRVGFYTKSGERVSFKGHHKVSRPVRVEFYAKKKKQS